MRIRRATFEEVRCEEPGVEPGLEYEPSRVVWVADLEGASEDTVVLVHFLLRGHVVELFGQRGPFLAGLKVNRLGLLRLDETLGPVGQQG